jgi:hypothetical protein
MNNYKNIGNVNIRRTGGYLLLVALLMFILSVSFVVSMPTAPTAPTLISNTTYTSGLVNRSTDTRGTITTITLSATQQDYKWKAYVGNVSGKLALANSGGQAIYDWSTGTVTGEVYISRFSNINWATIGCVNQASWEAEHTALGISFTASDNINATFNATNHAALTVGTNPVLNGCKSTATYLSGVAQPMNAAALFQEILVRDTGTSNMVYVGKINANTAGYNGWNYDFQMIVAENESASMPSTYFFWVELG